MEKFCKDLREHAMKINNYEKKEMIQLTDEENKIITEDLYKDFANGVEKWFDTSNYDEDDNRPLPLGKNKKVIGLFKDELGGKMVIEFFGLRAKTYAFLMDDEN